MKIRIQKVMQSAGVASRRKAEDLIREGLVKVNGAIVTQMGFKVDPLSDAIKVKGKLINSKTTAAKMYIAFNKPKGCICTHHDPEGRETIWDILPNKLRNKKLAIAGRLDFQTEGLVILSNDGDFIQRCAHPSHHIEKKYAVKVRGTPKETFLTKLRRGIVIDGKRSLPCKISRIARKETKHSWLEVTLHEGKNNQIRKMFYTIGHGVVKLKRTHIGNITLARLEPGACRALSKREILSLSNLK
jgi:23S rRNA pseudouridine2605 synthase